GPASFIRGRKSASPSGTRGGSRVPEWGPLGSVRGALSNERPYRDLRNVVGNYLFERSRKCRESSRIPATETVRVLSCGCHSGVNSREDNGIIVFDISTAAAAHGPAGLCGRAKQAAQSRAA